MVSNLSQTVGCRVDQYYTSYLLNPITIVQFQLGQQRDYYRLTGGTDSTPYALSVEFRVCCVCVCVCPATHHHQ